jgi:lipopolysaccharide/colanic/teichoic acid biosynthesis glycosyltransferase
LEQGRIRQQPSTQEQVYRVDNKSFKRESGIRRKALVDELYRDLGHRRGGRSVRSMRAGLKRFSWVAIVAGTTLFKRLMDILLSAAALLALSPLFLLVALSIWLQDRGSPLFYQMRVGQWGREFRFPKFRSMVRNAETLKKELQAANQHGSEGVTFKMKRDPRITRVGAIIRKLSIDELPQLWCVLKGEMSLVGPRPPVPSEVARYTLADRRRLDVKPGLTCIWQVSGRSELAFDKQVSLDVQYIDSHSIWMDVALLLKTIPAILTGRGAY